MKVIQTEILLEEINVEIVVKFFDPMIDRYVVAYFINYVPMKKIMIFIHPQLTDEELNQQVEIEINSRLTKKQKDKQIETLYIEKEMLKKFYNDNKESLLRYFMNECPSTRIRFMQLLRG